MDGWIDVTQTRKHNSKESGVYSDCWIPLNDCLGFEIGIANVDEGDEPSVGWIWNRHFRLVSGHRRSD